MYYDAVNRPTGMEVVTNNGTTTVWVSNIADNTISILNTDGSFITSLSGSTISRPESMAIVGSQVWVANLGECGGCGFVSRFNFDGTSAGATIPSNRFTGGANPVDIQVVGSTVWVTNLGGTIFAFNTDTSNATISPISGNGLNAAYGIAQVGSQVWVVNSGNNTISIFNTDGTSAGSALTGNGLNSPIGIAVVGSQVWVANSGNDTISRFNTDGSSAGSALSTLQWDGLHKPNFITNVGSEVWVSNPNSSNGGAVHFSSIGNNQIYNNTFNRNGGNFLNQDNGTSAAITFKNNIAVGGSVGSVPSGSTFDYNLYYGVSAPASQDAHSLVGQDPFFSSSSVLFNSASYKLQRTSPAINTGTTVTPVTDILGTTRPQGSTYDMGAYEFPTANPASNLRQFQSDRTTAITSGGYYAGSPVVFKMDMTSANTTDSLTPEVEIQPVTTAFTNTPNLTGSAVTFSGSSVIGTVSTSSLNLGTTYHWQARVSNAAGSSSWTDFTGDPDFIYSSPPTPTLTPTSTPTPVAQTLNSNNHPQVVQNPNIHENWVAEVKAGPHFVGTPQFLKSVDAPGAAVLIGNNSVHDDLNLKIEKVDWAYFILSKWTMPWKSGVNMMGDIINYKAVSAFNGYPILTSDKPFTIVIPYDPVKLKNKNPKNLKVYIYNEAKKKWIKNSKPIVVDMLITLFRQPQLLSDML